MTSMTYAELTSIFKRPGEHVQMAAVSKVSKMGTAGRDMLIQIWNTEKSIDVRRWAVHGLGRFSDVASKNTIKKALLDPAMSIRLHAIRAIGDIGDSTLGAKVKPLMNDESGGIRINALDVLVQLRVRGYKAILNRCLSDPKKYIRDRALYYMK